MLDEAPITEEPYLFWRLVDEVGLNHASYATEYVRLHMEVLKSTYPEALYAFKRLISG